jgi:hypothetical protein
MERTPEWMSDRIAEQDAEIAALQDKALAYDLDRAGIERRAAEAVELVEARAEIAALRGLCNWASGRLLDAGDVQGHEQMLRSLRGESGDA